MEGFVIQDHLRSRYTIVDSILSYIIYTAFGKVRIVCVASLGVRVTSQFELFCRVSFGNGYEVVEFALFGSKRLIFVESEVDAVEIVIIIYMRSFYGSRSRSFIDRSRSFFYRSCFVAATETIGQAGDKAFIGNVGIVFQADFTFVSQFRVEVTVTGADVEVRRNAVAEAGFPHGCALRAESAFGINVKVLGKLCFGDKTNLSYVIGVAPNAEVVIDTVPAGEYGKVLVKAIDEVDFVFVAICLITCCFMIAFSFQAIVVILQGQFVRKSIRKTALEIPFGIRAYISTAIIPVGRIYFSLRIPGAEVDLPLALFKLCLRSCKRKRRYARCRSNECQYFLFHHKYPTLS